MFNDLSKFYVERPNYAKGGKMCLECGGKMKRNYGGEMTPDLSVLQGGQLNQMAPSTVEVQANNPGALDSVELPQAYVSDNETISQMQDGSKYVFSDVLKNPYTGMTFAEEDKKLAKIEAKVMNKKTKYGRPEQGTIKFIQQQREQLAGLNDMMRQLDELKNGITTVAGKPAAQGGGWLNGIRKAVQDASDMQARGVANLNMGAFQQPAQSVNIPMTTEVTSQVPGPSSISRVNRKGALRDGISTNYMDNNSYHAYPLRTFMNDGSVQLDFRYPIQYRNTSSTIPSPSVADETITSRPASSPAIGTTTPAIGKKTTGKKANPKAVVTKSTTPN